MQAPATLLSLADRASAAEALLGLTAHYNRSQEITPQPSSGTASPTRGASPSRGESAATKPAGPALPQQQQQQQQGVAPWRFASEEKQP